MKLAARVEYLYDCFVAGTPQLKRDPFGTHDPMAINDQVDREELERQLRRVGITWDTFSELGRLNNPNIPNAPDSSVAIELDYRSTTAFLRTLPDGAGQATFIAAWLKHTEPLRKKAEAAMRYVTELSGNMGDTFGGHPRMM